MKKEGGVETKEIDLKELFKNYDDLHEVSLRLWNLEFSGYIPEMKGIIWVNQAEVG